jgi:carboxyl-terminal processing protease
MAENTSRPLSGFNRTQSILFMGLIVLLVIVSFSLGYFSRQLYDERFGKFALVEEAFRIFNDHALGRLPDQLKLEHGMIRGMLQAYGDPYTILVEPAQAELQTDQLNGKFGGVGVRLDKDKQNNILLYPLPNSPSLKAGIQEGDRLVRIDQLSIQATTTLEEIQAAIRGPVGSSAKLTIARQPDYQSIQISIKREEVSIPSVTSNLVPDHPEIGIIQVNVIADTSPSEIQKAQNDLKERGAKYFILDLRNNGGGLVDAGVNCARLFMNRSSIVIQEQVKGEDVKTFSVDQDGPLMSIPLVILVNQNTASAAEILAGTLQAQKRAILIGNKTYGKDVIQLVYDLQDGSSLHITSGKWWVPGQEGLVGGKGLHPDVVLNDEETNSNAAVQAAVNEFGK